MVNDDGIKRATEFCRLVAQWAERFDYFGLLTSHPNRN